MKKNTTITFLILLSIIISTPTIAEDIAVDASVSTTAEVGVITDQIRPEPKRPETKRPEPVRPLSPRPELRKIVEVKIDEMKTARASTTADIKMMREQNQEGIKKMRADFKTEVKSRTASTTEVIKEKRMELIKAVQEKRDIFKEEFDIRRASMASTTADVRAKFKADLSKIKDEKKKERVENVGNNLIELNTKITTRSSERVGKIEEILIALESRADKASVEGINMTNVLAHIANSEAIIAEARLAISVQSAKTYAVTITDESTVKTSLQATRDLLRKDIEAMNIKIKSAHEATKKALEAYKIVAKVDVNATTTVN